MNNWIKFDEGGRSFQPRATVSTNGYIALSHGACTRFGIDERYKSVILYYNEDTKEIGIEFVEDEGPKYARRLRHRDKGADFSAAPFLDRFDIRPAVTVRCDIRRDDESGFLVINCADGRKRRSAK